MIYFELRWAGSPITPTYLYFYLAFVIETDRNAKTELLKGGWFLNPTSPGIQQCLLEIVDVYK